MNKQYAVTTQKNSILLTIGDYDEPNNGRSLWIADLLMNTIKCNHYFFENNNRVNFDLSNFIFNNSHDGFVFIPAEGYSFLIDTASLQLHRLPYVNLSTLHFIGNFFYCNKLIVIYTTCVHVFNCYTNETQVHSFVKGIIKNYALAKRSLQIALNNIDNNTISYKEILLL